MPANLDGNVLAGPLSEVFQFDSTTALVECMHCGDVKVFAVAQVWEDPMGLVARCSTCAEVLMTVVETATGTVIELRGIASLRVQSEAVAD
ncbi:MAG: hypothetical protein QOI02_1242 [Actinomycetota bacterium]|jgi:hypothetical protein|nr:hypothetical protein [Glaciihabitans sp.]MDQ1556240.1 hypothetical protein [Actinomycetota bacterium]